MTILNRFFILFLMVFFLSVLTLHSDAVAEKADISKQDLNKILNKLDELTNQNKELNERVKALESGRTPTQSKDIDILKEDVAELSDLIQVVEKKSMLDRVEIDAELRTRCDWFTYRDDDTNHDESVDAIFSNRFRLNLFSKIRDNMQIHARLTMYHIWDDGSVPGFPRANEFNRARDAGDTDLKVERVYADYFFDINEIPFALSFGRMPTTDGLPTDLRDNTPRKSTYPGILWDMETDAIGLSMGLEKLIGLKDSALRFLYGRIVEDGDENIYRRSSYDINDIDAYFLQFETGFKSMPDTQLFITYLYIPDFMAADLRPLGLEPIDIQGELGAVYKFSIYFQSRRFLDSDFDIFAGFCYSESDGNGEDVWGALGGLVKVETRLNKGAGRAWYAGFRYNFPWDFFHGGKFGAEYNTGSKYYIGANFAAEDPLHKLDNRGHAWDFYYLQPINRNFNVRCGYTLMHKRYAGSGSANFPERVDEDITNAYILLDAKF